MKLLKPFSSHLDCTNFSCKGFFDFLKQNKILFFVSLFALLAIYAVRFSAIPFGVDTEMHLANSRYINWLQIGRFGLVGLQKLLTNFLQGKELFNPFLHTFLATLFLLFGTLLWCYLIDFFSCKNIKKTLFIPFAVLVLSHQVWAEQIYFVLQASECLFIYFLSPIIVFLLFFGVLNAQIKKIVFGILLFSLCISVYQGIIPLIFCGIFACFILFEENGAKIEKLEKNSVFNFKNKMRFCIILLVAMLLSVLLYFVLNFWVQHLLGVEKSNYLTQNIAKQSFLQTIIRFCGYIYTLVFVNCVPDSFLKMLLVKFAPTQIHIFELMKNISLMATVFIIPATILFFINVYKSSKKSIFSLFSSICMILCVVALPLLGGGMVALRSQYVLPFFVAFLFLYISSKTKNKWQTFCFILFMLVASRQTLICSMLNYSDVIRYNYDVRLSSEIASRIIQTGASKETPILLYGKSKFDFNNNFLKGEAIAHSSFAWDTQYNSEKYCTSRGIAFMKLHGFYFTEVNDTKLIEKAKEFAKNMQDFPHKNSVCNLGDVVIVRLSESEY